MDLLRRETWLRYGADMLRTRRGMSESKFHAYFGIHSVTAVWLWAFLLPRWPHRVTLLVPQHLMWTLWFLRKYPTEDHLSSRSGAHHRTCPTDRLGLRGAHRAAAAVCECLLFEISFTFASFESLLCHAGSS